MRIKYGLAFRERTLEIPDSIAIRWACKRCQANGIMETDADAGRGPHGGFTDVVVQLSERVAVTHMEASPDCYKAAIHLELRPYTIRDVGEEKDNRPGFKS